MKAASRAMTKSFRTQTCGGGGHLAPNHDLITINHARRSHFAHYSHPKMNAR